MKFPILLTGVLRLGLVIAGVGLIFSVAIADDIRYDNAVQRDPFVPLIGPGADWDEGANKDTLRVEGIIFDPRGGSYAVIGDEIYKEGEEFEGTKIVRILPDRIVFFQGNEEMVIWLREEVVNEKKSDEEQE